MAAKTILLKGRGIRKEALAAGAITPGHLVELTSAGLIKKHATSGGNVTPAFAVENELIGDEISTVIASGDNCVYEVMPRGSEVYALLHSAQNVAIGDKLMSAGDGTLRSLTAQQLSTTGNVITDLIVATALQAVDNSASATATRIIVEVA